MTLARLKRRLEKAEKRLSELDNHIDALNQEWLELESQRRALEEKIETHESLGRQFVNAFRP